MIHSSGMGAMSVVRNVVTPSIQLDGTNASTVHRSRRFQLTDSVCVSAVLWFTGDDRHIRNAQAVIITTNNEYPNRQPDD